MNPHKTANSAHRKMSLASGFVLLAASLAAGLAQAQTWKSHLSPREPEVIFRQYCAVCHGDKGDGKSLAAYAFEPPPKDFTSDESRNELSRAMMIEALNNGAFTEEKKPTAMIPWKSHLSREQIAAVVDYIIVRFMDGKTVPNDHPNPEGHWHDSHAVAKIKAVDYPFGLKPNASNGKSVYAANCLACHGENGDGKGKSALAASIRPRNFHDADFHEFANGFTLFSAVTRGRGHMPAWDKKLSNQEIADVSEYLLQTFVKPHQAASHDHKSHHAE